MINSIFKKFYQIITIKIAFLFHLFSVGFLPNQIKVIDCGPYPVARSGRRRHGHSRSSKHPDGVSSGCCCRSCPDGRSPCCHHPRCWRNGRSSCTWSADSLVCLQTYRRCSGRRGRLGREIFIGRVNRFVCYQRIGSWSFETIVLVVTRSVDRHDDGRRFDFGWTSRRTVDGRDQVI